MKKTYAIYDNRRNEIYEFQNQEAGTQHLAIYTNKADADKICAKMNEGSSYNKYSVKERFENTEDDEDEFHFRANRLNGSQIWIKGIDY